MADWPTTGAHIELMYTDKNNYVVITARKDGLPLRLYRGQELRVSGIESHQPGPHHQDEALGQWRVECVGDDGYTALARRSST